MCDGLACERCGGDEGCVRFIVRLTIQIHICFCMFNCLSFHSSLLLFFSLLAPSFIPLSCTIYFCLCFLISISNQMPNPNQEIPPWEVSLMQATYLGKAPSYPSYPIPTSKLQTYLHTYPTPYIEIPYLGKCVRDTRPRLN